MLNVQTRTVFDTMRADLALVEDRVAQAAHVDYPIVASLVDDIVRAGGKRLRPLVLLLAGRAYRYDLDSLVTAAAGVELLHTASLVHDDTVDRSSLRRGKPTLNSVLNSGAVILIGDFLFAQSAVLAAATQSPRAVAIFASTLAAICDGQIREMLEAHRIDQSRADYERRIAGKTASLFAGAAEMGAVLAGAPEADVQALRDYGLNLGLAFQVIDDVLDLREREVDLGKPTGQDLRQGNITLPTMLYAAGLVPGSVAAARLRMIVTGDLDDQTAIDAVAEDIRASGAVDAAMDVAASYVERAKRCVVAVPSVESRELLEEVADFVLHRSS